MNLHTIAQADVVADPAVPFAQVGNVVALVPTTGQGPWLRRCLEALLNQTVPLREIVVMLDAAADPSQVALPDDSRVRCLTAPASASFCAAANAGIRATASAWVFLVNDDVVLAPDFLQRLLAGLAHEPRVGMVCGRLRSADGVHLDSTGQFLRRSWTARERGYGELDQEQYNRPGEVVSVCAAAALYRRHMLDAIAEDGQYFDERFGMYLEDLDLGLRAQRAGWRAYYVPDAMGTHARGATAKHGTTSDGWIARYYLPQLPTVLLARYVRNRYRLIRKHGRWPRLLLDLPWLLWYELRLWGYLLCCRPAAITRLAQRRGARAS